MQSRAEVRATLEEHGLIAPRWSSRSRVPSVSGISRARALAKALQHLGGYFQAYAVFLSGRLDLLPAYFVDSLAEVPLPFLGEAGNGAPPGGGELVFRESIGGRLFSRIWAAEFRGKPVVVEELATLLSTHETRWQAFSTGIALLAETPERQLASTAVLLEFRDWFEVHLDLGRKCRMMVNLGSTPGGCLLRVPKVFEGLCAPGFLVYEMASGDESLSESGRQAETVVEARLEQIMILSWVAATADTSELRFVEGKVTFRVWPFLVPIPVQQYYPLLQYLASSIADDSGRAVRMLAKLARAEGVPVSETEIWRKVSGLKFEMGLDEMLPESVLRVTENWRALAGTGVRLPLSLNLVHQQLVLSGRRWVASAVDWLPVAAATVLTRLVQFRTTNAVGLEGAREWGMGGGLMFLGAFRQMGTLLEQLRENDLSVTVTTSSQTPSSGRHSTFARSLVPGLLFALSLQASLWWTGSTWGSWLGVLAALSGTTFLWMTVRKAS